MKSRESAGSIPAIILGFSIAASARADHPLEILDLTSRPVEDVIPLVMPLAGPDGTVTGTGSTLIIRAAPQRMADIRRLLKTLDRPPRNLVIQLLHGSEIKNSGIGVAASVDEVVGAGVRIRTAPPTPGRGSRIEADAGTSVDNRAISQQIRVLEGHRTYISAGIERPAGYRERSIGPDGAYDRNGVTYRRTESGFYVLPRVVSDRVTLDISAFDSGPLDRNGMAMGGDLQARVTGRLGEWIPLGGTAVDESQRDNGIAYLREWEQHGQRNLYLRVLEVP